MTVTAAQPNPAADIEALFASRGWLARHPPAFRRVLLAEALTLHMAPGVYVYREGAESHGLYGIIAGGIGVEGGHPEQTPMLGHVHRAGEWFGMRAPLDGGPRALSYLALEPSQLVFIPNSRLVPLMRSDADHAIRVGQLGEAGSRLSSRIIRDLLTRDARRRLAAVLLRVTGDGELVPDDPSGFWLTHRQLGEMANLSRIHVGRKLGDFETAGWISCGYNRIRLRNVKHLKAFAYGDDAS